MWCGSGKDAHPEQWQAPARADLHDGVERGRRLIGEEPRSVMTCRGELIDTLQRGHHFPRGVRHYQLERIAEAEALRFALHCSGKVEAQPGSVCARFLRQRLRFFARFMSMSVPRQNTPSNKR